MADDDKAATSDSSDSPAPKVPRVKHACVRCFKAKVKCSGEQPTCGRCVRQSVACTYNPEGNSRTKRRRKAPDARAAPPTSLSSGSGTSTKPKAAAESKGGAASSEVKVEEVPTVVIRQPFFRWMGLTSVMPPPLKGSSFRTLSVPVQERSPSSSTPAQPASPHPPPRNPLVLDPAEAETRVRTFYALFESYLPYMPLQETLEQLAQGTLSEIVLVSMSALVKRVRPDSPGPSAEDLADRAKALVIAHLAMPSLDTTYALLLLAYHEHGGDRDAGLWAYCGMAIRACIDLGLHKPFVAQDAAEAALRSRIFWAVACLDRILSCGCGRVTSIPLSQIEIDLPPPRDAVLTTQGELLPDPFPTLCRLLLISGDVSDAVNTTSPHTSSSHPQVPIPIQLDLAEYQATLPPPLHFSIQTFTAYVNAGYAQAFLLLSLWHQAVHLAIHDAALLYADPGLDEASTPAAHGLSPLSGSAAISIADMLAYSSVIGEDAFLCTPTMSQPILMAGRAASTLLRARTSAVAASFSSASAAAYPLPLPPPLASQVEPLERSVAICQKTLERMRHLWLGLSWHVEAMTKNAREADFSDIGATIVTDDKGLVAKAKLQDLAQRCGWLLDELTATPTQGEVVGVGLSSWGLSADPIATTSTATTTAAAAPQSTVAVLRSGRSSPLLWNDQSGGVVTGFASNMNAFWGGDWATWPTMGGGTEGLEDVLALPPPPP
ncbi:hypothetical protein JCM6882_003712 [Rhodosporidiobolus microsporus]